MCVYVCVCVFFCLGPRSLSAVGDNILLPTHGPRAATLTISTAPFEASGRGVPSRVDPKAGSTMRQCRNVAPAGRLPLAGNPAPRGSAGACASKSHAPLSHAPITHIPPALRISDVHLTLQCCSQRFYGLECRREGIWIARVSEDFLWSHSSSPCLHGKCWACFL